ncbi:MAG TPA: glycosyltransferase, partial [Steroidobacteraceae bacterium]
MLGDEAIKPKPGPALNVARPRNITYSGDCETSGRGDVPSPHRRFFTAIRACDVDETAGWRMDSVLVEAHKPVARAPARPAPELSVIVPTFNERANIPLLVARLQRTLEGADWEVIFVDDNS